MHSQNFDSAKHTPNPEGSRIGRVELGCFRIKRLIGRGSYGTAYLADQIGFDRNAVVKIAHPELIRGRDAQLIRRRFADELRAATRAHHPNLVTLYTAGETIDGMPAIAMEYVAGEPLENKLLEQEGRPSSAWLEPCFSQLAGALGALHAAGVVHRDLSPRNVMLGLDLAGLPKATILDFGVAKLAGQAGGSTGAVGTPRYMAPEQVLGRAGPAADIFALGAILWWALTGQEFRSDIVNLDSLTHARLSGRRGNDPRQLRPDLPNAVSQLVTQMLAFEESRRMTAAEFLVRWKDAVQELPADSGGSTRTRMRAQTEPMHVSSTAHSVVTRSELGTVPTSGALFVVLIDPNPITSRLLQGFLRRNGCKVRIVTDALELSERDAGSIDLVIVSSDLPGAGTVGTISRVLQELPDLAIVVTGGQRAASDYIDLGARSVLEVPAEFDQLEALLASLRQELSLRGRSASLGVTGIDAQVRAHLETEDAAVVRDTIEMFVGSVPELLARMSDAVAVGNVTTAQHTCRTLETNARALGASQLARLAHACVELMREGDTLTIPGFVSEMEREYGLVFRDLMSLHANAGEVSLR